MTSAAEEYPPPETLGRLGDRLPDPLPHRRWTGRGSFLVRLLREPLAAVALCLFLPRGGSTA